MRQALLILLALLLPLPAAYAGPKEDAQAAYDRFFAAFVAGNQAEVAAMFAPDAQFYGTLSPELVISSDGVRQYFTRSLSGPAVMKAESLGSTALPLGDNVVAIAGQWRLDRTLEGKTTPFGPYRITAVLAKRGEHWQIVQFHNSPKPAPPAPPASAPPR
jgi:uncharacterized protein (TIGR02246 family)